MLVALQVIVIAVLSSVIYSNTVNTYLTAKNDIIEYWLDMAKDYILSDPAMLWAMDYWTEHPRESRNEDDAKVKKSTLLTYYYENILADTDEATIKNLENESEEMQLYLAQYYFSDFVYLFDNNEFSKYGVSGLNCFRGDDDGNIFLYRAKDANGHVYELTPLSSDINIRGKESVIRAIKSRSYDEDSPSGVIYQMEKPAIQKTTSKGRSTFMSDIRPLFTTAR